MDNINKTWADQWGTGPFEDVYEKPDNYKIKRLGGPKQKSKKMEAVKTAASTGVVKAKSGAIYGAKKIKSGTSIGIKWIKRQYKKKFSSSK